jgi:hypothetical protein
MTATTVETSPLVRARLAGFWYLFANLFAPLVLVFLPARFIVSGDAAATASNIMASESLFRVGVVLSLFTFIAQIFLALALYQLLKVVNKNMAALMVIFALTAVPIAMLNELNNLAVVVLLSGIAYLKPFPTDQLQALAYMFLRLHGQGLNIAQIFWGLWLFPMGSLVFKSGFLPRLLGVLLIIAAFGYVIQSFAVFLWPSRQLDLIFVTGWGELLLLLWLLMRGVNVEQWNKRAAESAGSNAL